MMSTTPSTKPMMPRVQTALASEHPLWLATCTSTELHAAWLFDATSIPMAPNTMKTVPKPNAADAPFPRGGPGGRCLRGSAAGSCGVR